MLSVNEDDQGLMFDALGTSTMMSGRDSKSLSPQDAAEFLWDLFIRSMQDRRR